MILYALKYFPAYILDIFLYKITGIMTHVKQKSRLRKLHQLITQSPR